MVGNWKKVVVVRIFSAPDFIFPCQSLIALNIGETGCDICERTVTDLKANGGSPESHRLVVDHDHTTGNIRGMLCDRCNGFLAKYEKLLAKYETPSFTPSTGWRGKYKKKIGDYLNKPQLGSYDAKGQRRNYRQSRTGSVHTRPDVRADKIAAKTAARMAKRALAKRELEIEN